MDQSFQLNIIDFVIPIIIFAAIYFLFVIYAQFNHTKLSKPVHVAYRSTLVIMIALSAILLIEDSIRNNVNFMWGLLLIPLSIGCFILVWSVSTVFEYWTQSSYVEVEVTSRNRTIAVSIIILSVIFLIGYLLML